MPKKDFEYASEKMLHVSSLPQVFCELLVCK